jgi:hypothetical protein
VAQQNSLTADEYKGLMMDRLDESLEKWCDAPEEIEKEKLWVARAYNKRVREKLFQVDNLVWKTILPLGSRDCKFGKLSLNWEGPYRVIKVVPGNSYFIETLDGKEVARELKREIPEKVLPKCLARILMNDK